MQPTSNSNVISLKRQPLRVRSGKSSAAKKVARPVDSGGSTMLISSDSDVITAREQGRALAERAGFIGTDVTIIATAVSEVARIIAHRTLPGELDLCIAQKPAKTGVTISARITSADTSKLNLPEVRQLLDVMSQMDDIEVQYQSDERILMMRKWRANLWDDPTPPIVSINSMNRMQ